MSKLSVYLNTRVEEVAGVVSASVVGVITHYTIEDVLITAAVAISTGFLGALGTHLFKVLRNKLSKNE